MHSKITIFLATTACILQLGTGWPYFRSGGNRGQAKEKDSITSSECSSGRRLGWLSDMIAKAAKDARKKTSRPTKLPTRKPTKMPTPKPTLIHTPSPVQSPTMSPTTKSPTNVIDETPTQSPTKLPTSSPTSLENICLTDPADKYRTCFQRAVDPRNVLTQDEILRDKYNIGALMYERGMDISSPSIDTYLAPYTGPNAMSDEDLINGTVYLSLVTKGVNNLTCDDQIKLEEVTLKWAKDNVGAPETFSPVCVFNDGYALYNESSIDDNGIEIVIETAAFKMDFVFVSKDGWFNETYSNETYDDDYYYYYYYYDDDDDEEDDGESESNIERLLKKNKKPKADKKPKIKCEESGQYECCIADKVNKNDDDVTTKKKSCKKKNCPTARCTTNKGRGLHSKASKGAKLNAPVDLIDVDLFGTDFNKIIKKYTVLDPISTGAVLDATSLEEMAKCRASNYNATEYESPTLECDDYNQSSCEENDYLIVVTNETDVDDNFCLPDDFYCNDDNLCTLNTWDPYNFSCESTPINCPNEQSCDPADGMCKTVSYYWNETVKLTPSDGAENEGFGYSVSISDDIAIIGGNDNGGTGFSSAYVFERDDSTGFWDEKAKLTPSGGAIFEDGFGMSVSVSGNTAVVGAPWDDDMGNYSGSAYLFERDKSTGFWDEKAKLTASDGEDFDNFGFSVSVFGNVAIVGAPHHHYNDGNYSGFVYVFERDDSTDFWNEKAQLTPSGGAGSDRIGESVSVSGNTAIVGAPWDDDKGDNSGSVYMYEKAEPTGFWNETAKLTASDGDDFDNFGFSVSVSGNAAIVGAPYDDNDSGSAYIFEKDDSTGVWKETVKLTSSYKTEYAYFGWRVSISSTTAIVGESHEYGDGNHSGSAYVFERDDSTGFWNETAKLTIDADLFGESVSVFGNAAIVGAPYDDAFGNYSGAVYIFEKVQKYP